MSDEEFSDEVRSVQVNARFSVEELTVIRKAFAAGDPRIPLAPLVREGVMEAARLRLATPEAADSTTKYRSIAEIMTDSRPAPRPQTPPPDERMVVRSCAFEIVAAIVEELQAGKEREASDDGVFYRRKMEQLPDALVDASAEAVRESTQSLPVDLRDKILGLMGIGS